MAKRRRYGRQYIDGLRFDENHKTTQLQKLVNFYRSDKVQTAITSTSKILDHVVPFVTDPGVITAAKALFGIANTLSENDFVYVDTFFDDNDMWSVPFTETITPLIIEECLKHPYEIITPTDSGSNTVIRICNVNGTKVGWVVPGHGSTMGKDVIFLVEFVYVERSREENLKETLRQQLWKRFKGESIVLTQERDNYRSTSKIKFTIDDLVDALPSEKATQYATDFSKAFSVGENRSLLLYGPPGSGKSTIARQTSKLLNLSSFRLRVDNLNTDANLLYEIIDFFRPGCIILDDFDRAHNVEHLLDMITHIRRHVKLVIATANNRDNIDEAILRPERFDELGFVKNLDSAVVHTMLGDVPDEVFEKVKDWPIVFIKEYVRRCKWLTPEGAINALEELATRVDRLTHYDDDKEDDELAGIGRLLRQARGKRERAKVIQIAKNTLDAIDEDKDDAEEGVGPDINFTPWKD